LFIKIFSGGKMSISTLKSFEPGFYNPGFDDKTTFAVEGPVEAVADDDNQEKIEVPKSLLTRSIQWLRAEGESTGIQIWKKIAAFAIAALLALSIVGIVIVVDGAREWKRQEKAFEDLIPKEDIKPKKNIDSDAATKATTPVGEKKKSCQPLAEASLKPLYQNFYGTVEKTEVDEVATPFLIAKDDDAHKIPNLVESDSSDSSDSDDDFLATEGTLAQPSATLTPQQIVSSSVFPTEKISAFSHASISVNQEQQEQTKKAISKVADSIFGPMQTSFTQSFPPLFEPMQTSFTPSFPALFETMEPSFTPSFPTLTQTDLALSFALKQGIALPNPVVVEDEKDADVHVAESAKKEADKAVVEPTLVVPATENAPSVAAEKPVIEAETKAEGETPKKQK
jgi:hypothetical protein